MEAIYRRILAAIDFSECTENLLKKAQKIASQQKASMTLIHVVEPSPLAEHIYVDKSDYEQVLIKDIQEKIASFAPIVPIETMEQRIERGSPTELILEIIQQEGFDLLLMGSHGQHGIKALLGSTVASLIDHVPCDVLVVRC